MDHSQKAKELFLEGYNCSQSVLGAFSDLTGLDMETSVKIASSFGGGLGRMREVCGAVSGMCMAAGLIYGYDDPKASDEKKAHYERIQKLANEFKEDNGSFICRDLLGIGNEIITSKPEPRTGEYYKKRPCVQLVEQAAEILDNYIKMKTEK